MEKKDVKVDNSHSDLILDSSEKLEESDTTTNLS